MALQVSVSLHHSAMGAVKVPAPVHDLEASRISASSSQMEKGTHRADLLGVSSEI